MTSDCMAITAGTPCWTSTWAVPAKVSSLRGAGAVAGVEHGQAQRRVVLEEVGEARPAHGDAFALLVLENQHALPAQLAEAAMADEMEDMDRPAGAQPRLQGLEGGTLQPLDLDQAALHRSGSRAAPSRRHSSSASASSR